MSPPEFFCKDNTFPTKITHLRASQGTIQGFLMQF